MVGGVYCRFGFGLGLDLGESVCVWLFLDLGPLGVTSFVSSLCYLHYSLFVQDELVGTYFSF